MSIIIVEETSNRSVSEILFLRDVSGILTNLKSAVLSSEILTAQPSSFNLQEKCNLDNNQDSLHFTFKVYAIVQASNVPAR